MPPRCHMKPPSKRLAAHRERRLGPVDVSNDCKRPPLATDSQSDDVRAEPLDEELTHAVGGSVLTPLASSGACCLVAVAVDVFVSDRLDFGVATHASPPRPW